MQAREESASTAQALSEEEEKGRCVGLTDSLTD